MQPIDLLTVKLEQLQVEKQIADQNDNLPYSDLLRDEIYAYQQSIDILEAVKTRGFEHLIKKYRL